MSPLPAFRGYATPTRTRYLGRNGAKAHILINIRREKMIWYKAKERIKRNQIMLSVCSGGRA